MVGKLESTRGSKSIDDLEALFASGDADDFRRVFREYAPLVLRTCARILRDQQDAEDVTSEVFLEAWSKRSRYDATRASLGGYLVLLARSRALDRYRSRSRQRHRRGQNHGSHNRDADVRTIMDVSAAETAPDEQVADREMSRLARAALDSLGTARRLPLELSFYEGMSHSQIAKHLQMPLGTVKTHIRKGLLELRQVLAESRSRREHVD